MLIERTVDLQIVRMVDLLMGKIVVTSIRIIEYLYKMIDFLIFK